MPAFRLLVNFGFGKGKTTAALGVAVRALGAGQGVFWRSFVKDGVGTGEAEIAKAFGVAFDFRATGVGFIFGEKGSFPPELVARERENFFRETAAACASSASLAVLDEALWLWSLGLVTEEELLAEVGRINAERHVIVTGRNAPAALLARADTVTEMRCVKHAYDSGIPADRGIEF